MANCKFGKFQSPNKGNGLRATVHLLAGDLLYRATPYVYTVCKSGGRQACDFCLELPERLLRCSGCKFVKYCGLRCQREAWPDHRRECKCLKSIQPERPLETVRLVARAIFKLLKKSHCPSEELYSISELQANITELNDEMREGFSQLVVMLQLYLKAEIPSPLHLSADVNFFELFAKVACNTFSICNAEMQDLGAGLYPSMSLLNHDCDPNCVIVFEGKHLLLRAAREIQAGEELTTSYTNGMMPSTERQSQLKRQYSFECKCYRCETHDKDHLMESGDKRALAETKKAQSKALELQLKGEWEQSLAVCRAILNYNVDRLPDLNVYQVAILDCAMDACIYCGLFEEATLYGSRTLEAYRLYKPRRCPVKAIQMMKVGKLQYLHDKLPEALQTMKEAYDILVVTHGKDHRLTLELIEMLENCEVSNIAELLDLNIHHAS
ncbi:histone-lysine N-methyltransferase SMYD3-like [Ambystoma mexicanum]|uniref:histone-lysine N-methyltransferase SMYD3-like n=1 Tax=Ambystoma mexicanum TaxID=8296 RepID=UPI0037E76740